MTLGRIIQIIGMIVVLDALYFGIARDSMKVEVLLLFIGAVIFYLGRSFEKKR
ncbi:MAG: hypothetical protein JETT_2368 [Candidatus Jettenia ecosi]|uniref:Uncharacterized protein n=1 Tax=Candidatus Jettenia ecosi TaxID=2494326 RepID=A0A533QFA2_9BACT|nr:MAG: hypothetical protein JETT_2368 [Candidatus Jettenia ecosi]